MVFHIWEHSLCDSAGTTYNYGVYADYLILTPLHELSLYYATCTTNDLPAGQKLGVLGVSVPGSISIPESSSVQIVLGHPCVL
jgi:hypothetical protein